MSTLADLLEDRRVCICAGPGGVGKTTASAAIAAGMAARGRRVAVVTIDPARRLAHSLGLTELSGEPRRVDADRFAAHGLPLDGELWALMLDVKGTFDGLIARLAPDERARDEVLGNPVYQQLSSAVAGSQEFTAIAKLDELHSEGAFDLLVLDTPPSRNALDFLDAPERLLSFFEGRTARALLRPAGVGGRLFGRSAGITFHLLRRLTGVDMLDDVSTFFAALGGIVQGLRERAERVAHLLADPATTFLVITSPEHAPVSEAIWFRRRLEAAALPFGGLVVNRVHEAPAVPEPAAVAAALSRELGASLAGRVAASAAELAALAARDRDNVDRLLDELGHPPTVLVPRLTDEVHDVAALARVSAHLLGGRDPQRP